MIAVCLFCTNTMNVRKLFCNKFANSSPYFYHTTSQKAQYLSDTLVVVVLQIFLRSLRLSDRLSHSNCHTAFRSPRSTLLITFQSEFPSQNFLKNKKITIFFAHKHCHCVSGRCLFAKKASQLWMCVEQRVLFALHIDEICKLMCKFGPSMYDSLRM